MGMYPQTAMPVSWFNPRRLLGPIVAAFATVLAILTLDTSLAAVCGEQVAWLPPPFGTERLAEIHSRAARFEELDRAGTVADSNLIAVLGLSQVRHDLDARTLGANDPRHRDWMVLGADGRTLRQLAIFGRALAESSLRPRMVILGVAMTQAHREDGDGDDSGLSRLPSDLRHRRYWEAMRDVSWLVRQRLAMEEEWVLWRDAGAHAVRAAFGLPMNATYVPEEDAFSVWRGAVMQPMPLTGGLPLDGPRSLLTVDQFDKNQRQVEALAGLIRDFRAKGAEVIGVLMPESARLRAAYPPEIAARFNQTVAAACGGQPIRIIDLRAGVPDSLFHDDGHLSEAGRQRLSALLPGLLP